MKQRKTALNEPMAFTDLLLAVRIIFVTIRAQCYGQSVWSVALREDVDGG
jgi:hypothetical protein